MQAYPNFLETQKQNELRKIAEAQNRLAYLDQQQQMQNGNINPWQTPNQMQNINTQFNMIIGKVVNDFDEVTAMDVPQNNQAAFFPKADGSEIQARARASNGLIQTVSYKPILDQNQAEATNISQMDFNALNEDVRALREDIKSVREMIEKSINTPAPKPAPRGKKTEVNADE